MAQKPADDPGVTRNISSVKVEEKKVASEILPAETKTEPATIAIVKSKIKEKDVPPPRSEKEELQNLKASKVSEIKISSKISKSRSKSKTSEASESDEPFNSTFPANAAPADRSTESKLERNQKSTLDSKSKKSLQSQKLESKSKKLLDVIEDERTNIQPELNKNLYDDTESTFVMSHEEEPPKEQNLDTPSSMGLKAENSLPAPNPLPSLKNVYQRGNYMNNVVPEPIEEYTRELDENKENKSQN